MIEIKNLKSGYGKIEVLHKVDLKIADEEITTIIGPNGSGKSTIIKSICGIADIFSGSIFLDKKNIILMSPSKLINLGIAYIPQGKNTFDELTVLENLELGGEFLNNKELLKTRIEEIFKRYPILEKRKNKLAYGLSGGEKQMLAFGRALIQRPKLIILDEPSIGLSPILQKDLFKTIKELKEKGISILMVEQNAKKAIEISDKVYLLENGEISLHGNKNIIKNKKIRETYLGG